MTDDEREVLGELTSLANDLLQEATAIRRQWSELGDALGLELTQEVAAGAERATAPDEPLPAQDEDPVRLVALDMLLSGRSREDIERYLSQTFDEDYRPEVLDEVFQQYR